VNDHINGETIMSTNDELPHPERIDLPASELTDDPSEQDEAMWIAMVSSLESIDRPDELFERRHRQYGSGSLKVVTLPVEDTTAPTPKLVWTTTERLTCQTPLGRNLQLRGFELHLWRDARITFQGPMYNVSRHSDWHISFRVEVWYKSGHHTRPEATAHLGSLSLDHGRATRHTYRQYSDSLANLYNAYQAGELYLKFRIAGSRTN
jgi:hypothetical protein